MRTPRRPVTPGASNGAAAGEAFDVLLDPNGVVVRLEIKRRALVTDDVASQLLTEGAAESRPDTVLLLVGDRVTDAARRLLAESGAGYLDLRGRLALRTGRVVIDAAVEPVRERAGRVDALAGAVGLEVAVELLMEPHQPVGVRRFAAELGRSASTVSEVLSRLRADQLVERDGRVGDDRLFWLVVDRWPPSPPFWPAPRTRSPVEAVAAGT